MSSIRSYLSLIKFSHTIFALPFALIGFFLGLQPVSQAFGVEQWNLNQSLGWGVSEEGSGTGGILLKFLLVMGCMVFARSAAMAFNRYLDRSFDARNPRTAIREIPSGVIRANSALWFTIVSSLLFILCTWFINRICFYLSPVALLVVLGYSYTKRFTALCHFILGLGLSLAPIGAYLAVTGKFDLLPILFSMAVICWVSGFDIIYALQDVDFDRAQNLYSIPAWLGKASALLISRALHLLSAASVMVAGWYGQFGWLYWIGVAIFVGMLVYQHALVKPDDLRRVNLAFMTANGVASVFFAVFVIADLLFSTFNSNPPWPE